MRTQEKLAELQAGKKSLEEQVEALRTAKEEAEKPEKEAKDQHQRRWEGVSRGAALARVSCPGRSLGPGDPRSLSLSAVSWVNQPLFSLSYLF